MIIHYSTAYQWVLWLSFIKIQRSDRDYQQVSSPENYQFGVQKKRTRLIISWGGWIVVCTDIFTHGKLFLYSQSLPSVWWSWGDIKVTSCLAPIVYVYHLQISFNWFIDIVLVLKRNARNSIRKENRAFYLCFCVTEHDTHNIHISKWWRRKWFSKCWTLWLVNITQFTDIVCGVFSILNNQNLFPRVTNCCARTVSQDEECQLASLGSESPQPPSRLLWSDYSSRQWYPCQNGRN